MNRGIIKDHSFWEIREGHDANFLTASWKQLQNIISQIDIHTSWNRPKELGLTKIHHLFREAHVNEKFHEWKTKDWWNQRFPAEDIPKIVEFLQERRMRIQRGPDKLRWGYQSKGLYNIREAYNLTFN